MAQQLSVQQPAVQQPSPGGPTAWFLSLARVGRGSIARVAAIQQQFAHAHLDSPPVRIKIVNQKDCSWTEFLPRDGVIRHFPILPQNRYYQQGRPEKAEYDEYLSHSAHFNMRIAVFSLAGYLTNAMLNRYILCLLPILYSTRIRCIHYLLYFLPEDHC